MPSPLDLTHATHAKVLVAPPRLNLRRNASYTNCDRISAPLSATSSRFNFNHLLFSPPPSPSLPALLPRPRKSSTKVFVSRPSRIFRYFIYFTAIVSTFYLMEYAVQNRDSIIAAWPLSTTKDGHERVRQSAIPDFPTPIVVSHGHSKPKWTVSITHDHDFPLTMDEYAGICSRCREVSAHARELHGKAPLSDATKVASDSYFMDVHEAEEAGLLPPAGRGSLAKKTGQFVGLDWESMAGLPVCKTSLTYVLESTDAGLGTAVMAMWMLYGLTKHQGRAFFIDDSRWAYGTYTDIFKAPPLPDCRPPSRHQMLPCPAQARHLVVSSVTLKDIVPALMATHKNPRDLMGFARTGYESLFHLNKDDQDYVNNRIQELKGQAKAEQANVADAPVIGVHIRHGDRHPLEYQYRDTYIPSEVFLRKAEDLVDTHYRADRKNGTTYRAITIVASDDPMVYQQPEFADTFLAQERIRLASKEAAQETEQDPHVLHHFEDEKFGWEGGFFAPMFWNLGSEHRHNAVSGATGVAAPSEQTLNLRSLIGRAYMMDLAVLAGASDKVVCAVSAMGCRMLGVMKGWEEGIQGGGWANVDGDFEWAWMNW